jgi:polysaccharide pyruvyl transferase WcaK-like protein
MRILVEPSDYVLRNAGDMAMLHVAVTRLGAHWPDATIQIFSDAPDQLPQYCPNTRPLGSEGRRVWLSEGLINRPAAHAPVPLPGWLLRRLEGYLRHRAPRLFTRVMRRYGGIEPPLDQFLEAVSHASLLVVTGMGGITDAFPEYAHGVLTTLELAQQLGIPTAMVGQGMGPLDDAYLMRRARRVLPRVDFIAMREGLAGLPLMDRLGVRRDRVMVTGDDAIELAYLSRSAAMGGGVGLNLRAADYSGVRTDSLDQIREVVQRRARAVGAPLVAVPISRVPGEKDADTIRLLMTGYPAATEARDPAGWEEVFTQIRQTRVIVTGSYHAGVFGLAQGIPVIGVARSAYYGDKFRGLADQFGAGCTVVDLNQQDAYTRLDQAMVSLWQEAESLREPLLAQACRQIELGRIAYRRVFDLVAQRPALAS